MFSLCYSRNSFVATRGPILDRSKVLTRWGRVLYDGVKIFGDPTFHTLLPPANVRLNSKCQKTLVLFSWFPGQHNARDNHDSLWNRKTIDIPKTSRQLFPLRPLISEYQRRVRFYSIFGFSCLYFNRPRWEGIRRATTVALWFFHSPRPYLDGKRNRLGIGDRTVEHGVRFYCTGILVDKKHEFSAQNLF